MGKTMTCKYVLKHRYINFSNRSVETGIIHWNVKEYGKPTTENIREWRKRFNDSMNPGGVNHHIAKNFSPVSTAWIIEQKTGEEIARYTPPMFEVID